MSNSSVMDSYRRRRAIAALYRQADACRPFGRRSRGDLGDEPDQVLLAELESFFWRAERREPVW